MLKQSLLLLLLYSAVLPLSLICLTAYQLSTLMLMMMTAIMIVFVDDGNSTAAAAEFNCLQSFAKIMMMIAVLT